MSNPRRISVILLTAALVALGLVGPVAAVAPARAAASPVAAKAGAVSEPAAAPALETRRPATLTLEAPVAAPAVEPAVPPSTRDGWSVLMTEGFEGVFPSPGWVAFDNDGATNGEYFWAPDDYKPRTGTKSAWPGKGGANGVDPNLYFYPNDMRSWMEYGPFDLSGRTQANLDFWYWNQSELNYDWFFWGQSGNGTTYDGTQVSGDSLGWQHVTLDLSASLGDSSVYVAFVFNTDFSNYDDGPFVDDVTLNVYSGTVTRDWTYMVYLDGDNNLEAAAVNDFLEMSSVGSTSRVAVVAQMDRITSWDTTYDNWTDTRRFYITAGMTPAAANGTSIGEVNMGDPNTLVAFVQWAMATYPANRYALILWDHGSGWRSRALDDPLAQGIAYDDTSGGDGLSMVELRSALNTLTGGGANPFDLIGMDACLMALIEVDNQLRPYADVRVTSQEVEPNDGAPQDAILAALVANPTMTTEALATVYVDQYYASYGNDGTQSAADLGADYAALNTAVNNFAAALLANGAASAAGIQAARTAVQDFDFDYYIDLYDFASRVSANVANVAIDNAAATVMAALGPATIRERHGATWPGAHGLSIYFPKTLGEYDTRYDGTSGFLQFTAATQWDEWLRAYYGYAAGGAPANDGFGSAIVIGAVPYTNTQSVEGATTATDDPAFSSCWPGVGPKNRTVWYRYTAPSAQTLIVDTLGSNYDTVLGVWTGSQGSLVNVGCSDDAAPGFSHSRLEFAGSAGTTYYIEAADWNNPSATSQLTLNLTATGPGSFVKTAPANGATGQSLSPTLSWGTVAGALWYGYCYDTTNNDACDPISWTDNGTATSAVLSGLSPNTTYYWQVFASTSGLPVYADGGTWWSFTTGASSVPNDEIGAAAVIGGLPYTTTQSVADATTAPGDPGLSCASGSQGHHTVWYRYTSPTPQTIVADTLGSDYDTVLGVWTGSPGSLTNVGCSDDWTGLQSRVEFNAAAGTTYYIEAAAWNPASPTHQLVLNVGAFGKTSPANGATGQATNPTLSWGTSPGAVSYEYCYDFLNDGACNGLWVSTGAGTSVAVGPFGPSAEVFWQARAVYTWPGYSYANAGAWWSFTTAAAVAQEMSFRSVAAYDGWVLEQDEASGKGGTLDAAATTGRVGDDASDRQWRSILHFDTSGLPDGAVITGVTLKIKKQSIVGSNPFDTHGYLTVDQKTGAYHEDPALEKLDFHAVGSRGNVGRFIKTPASGWYRAPLRAPSYALVSLTGTTQFRLRFATDDNDNGVANYLSFYTGNAPTAGDRPELIVTYYVP